MPCIPDAYTPNEPSIIDIDYSSCQFGRFRYEGWLNAWFVQALSRRELGNIFGDYQEFLNLVPTSFNKVMDLFLIHTASIEGVDVTFKYTCIELKADRAEEKDLT